MPVILLDLEGTLVTGKSFNIVKGAPELIAALRQRGLPLRIVTNNTTDLPVILRERLALSQISVMADELITPLSLLERRLPLHGGVMVIGSDTLKSVVATLGREVREDADVSAVVVGGGGEISNELLSVACEALLNRRAALIGLHKNRLYIDERDKRMVGVGALIAALEYAANVEAIIVGKPSLYCFESALEGLSANLAEVVFVSDDPYSDLAGACALGMRTVFATTGKYGATEIQKVDFRPELVTGRLLDILDIL